MKHFKSGGAAQRDDYLTTCLRNPPRKDKRGVDLISDVLPFGRLWYAGPDAISNAVGYAKFYSRSHDAGIRVYDEAGKAICPVAVIY